MQNHVMCNLSVSAVNTALWNIVREYVFTFFFQNVKNVTFYVF